MSQDAQNSQPALMDRVMRALQKATGQIEELKYKAHEPIAVIGMACRFPGAASPEAFWALLRDGLDMVDEVPPTRWDVDEYYDPVPGTPGKMNTRNAALLEKIDHFDPTFFGISPREATSMDPQQRLLLEVSWEALERAGQSVAGLKGSQTGIFVGLMNSDYALLLELAQAMDAYGGTGNGFCFTSGRLSYTLGLQGPNMVIDTACSSSLVGLHLACQSLRAGESDLALAGGANAILTPERTLGIAQMQALSSDGRCKTFDAAANGYGRGEGCGMVVLKRLSDALADRDPILAVVRGSAVNHDGPSSGLTVPNAAAQAALIRRALENGNLEPEDVHYVDAHGTGTSLGDPIEVRALASVYGTSQRQSPLLISSVKTNIGHLESAAGVAGLIKVILSLQHATIPPHLHLVNPNPRIDWERLPVQVPTEPMDWPAGNKIAGVSSFGMGGTNAHVILEEAPDSATPANTTSQGDRPQHLLTLSAKNPQALLDLAQAYQAALQQQPEDSLGDLCYTAYTGRNHFEQRLAIAAATKQQLFAKLAAFTDGDLLTGVVQGDAPTQLAAPKVAFLFTGQGSQYVDMGRELYETNATFRSTIDRCDELLYEEMGESLVEILYPELENQQKTENEKQKTKNDGDGRSRDQRLYDVGLIDQTAYTQPALFALEYALAMLWQSWGIEPAVVIGHSVGEIVAACVAGIFSLVDGLKLVAARGRLMGALPQDGAMISIQADDSTSSSIEGRVREAIAPYSSDVAIAAINGPQRIVIAGKRDVVLTIAEQLAAEGFKTRDLNVSHAFHSPLMEPILDEFAAVAQTITYHKPKLPFISNLISPLRQAQGSVTERGASGREVTDWRYWISHIREPVRFADGLATLQEQDIDIFLEIGPKPTLLAMTRAIYDDMTEGEAKLVNPKSKMPLRGHSVIVNPTLLPSLREGYSDWQQMLTSLGELYVRGIEIDWEGFDRNYRRHKVVLPTYPFQRQRYWVDSATSQTAHDKATEQTAFTEWIATLDIETLTQQITDNVTADSNGAVDNTRLVTQILTAIQRKHEEQVKAQSLAGYLYTVDWQLKPPAPAAIEPTRGGRWLILADQSGVGLALARRLQAVGQHCTLLFRTDAMATVAAIEHGHDDITDITVVVANQDADKKIVHSPQQLNELLNHNNDGEAAGWRGIVHLWALDHTALTDPTADEIVQTQKEICGTLLHLLRAGEQGGDDQHGVPIWAVTRGAQVVSAKYDIPLLPPIQSPLWGLGRNISLEHPDAWGGLIDLDPADRNDHERTAKALWQELFATDDEEQIAYRQGKRYVARLTSAKPQFTSKPVTIHPDGIYLITGGLGGLGLHSARWLAESGARYLILTSRRGINTEEQHITVADLRAKGVDVRVAQVDVADAVGMKELFTEIAALPQPLRGVIHAAGVAGFQPVRSLDWDALATVLRPKVVGGWLLHELTQPFALDFFVGYSSGAGIWGSKEQAHYGAANHFLDGLMAYRHSQGLPGMSIAWGPWADGGMVTAEVQAMLQTMGVHSLVPAVGLAIQAHLLTTDAIQITAAEIEWSRLKRLYELTKPRHFLADVAATAQQADEQRFDSIDDEKPSLTQEVEALPTNRRLEYLRDYLQRVVGLVLGMTELPNRTTGFADLGMDSLMALEVQHQLQEALRHSLPTTIVFEYPTVDVLATYLLEEVLDLTASRRTETAIPAQQLGLGINEPIAVISMACRFPGADTPEAFWALLQNGMDMVQEMPASRWNADDYYDPQRPQPGKMYMREAAFVENVTDFDPLFFGIVPREAANMDPQHRLLLEVSWEVLERAGLAQRTLVDSQTGVFVGIGEGDYGNMHGTQDLSTLDTSAATAGGHSVAAGRLAYTLGLQGPTMAVDTACSSSLVSLHLACQSLRGGECDLALAGGVNLVLSPGGHIALSQMQALSADGRCKTFDAAADGYGRGEGGGMVLLKRLSDTEADGDTILAVIKGSAVNHDGASSGLTVPNKRAQEKLLQRALATAQVTPDEVTYIEAHGTGTALGDPIEIRALGAVFGTDRETPLLVGSVKTNIGHLEAGAGIAGFIKTVLALQHDQIPPHLHFNTPNPYIEWDAVAIDVPTTRRPWPAASRVAGVSSFGISGTNAHIVVESFSQESFSWEAGDGRQGTRDGRHETRDGRRETRDGGQEAGGTYLLPLSARNLAALSDLAGRYLDYLATNPALSLDDLCYTAAAGRNHFAHRLGIVAHNIDDLQEKLRVFKNQGKAAGLVSGITGQNRPRIAFLFTGQGSQYVNMGRELYASEPLFRSTIDRCDELLREHLDESLVEVIYDLRFINYEQQTNDKSDVNQKSEIVNQTTYTQPALFALEYALAVLWQSWGIEPDIVIGHSVGEIAAACVAGVFTLEDGLKLVAARGRLMGALPAGGEMVAVATDEARVQAMIAECGAGAAQVSIAAVNGPESVVISGKGEGVRAIVDQFAAEGIKTRQLAVSHAFHSSLMEPMLDDFAAVARSIAYQLPRIPIVSNGTGQLATDQLADWQYWVSHVREPVRFADGMATLHEQQIDICLEIGPKPTLLGLAAQPVASDQRPTTSYLPSLREGHSDWTQMLTSLGELYVRGVAIDWERFYGDVQRQKILLPTYPFQRQRCWVETPHPSASSVWGRGQTGGLRPLIDQQTRIPRQKQTIFEKRFSTATLPFLLDHHVMGEVVVPGACQLAVALSGADMLFEGAPCELLDVVFPQALALLDGEERMVQLITEVQERRTTNDTSSFQINSFAEDDLEAEPLLHVTGRLRRADAVAPTFSLADCQARCTTSLIPEELYDLIAAGEIVLGPTFRWFAAIWQGTDNDALAQMRVPAEILSTEGYPLFPSLIDACFQLGAAMALGSDQQAAGEVVRLPFAVESLTLHAPTDHRDLWCYAKYRGETTWDITLFTAAGQVIAQITGFQMREVPSATLYGDRVRTDWLHTLAWQPQPLPRQTRPTATPDYWLIFGAATGASAQFAASLAADGIPTLLVTAGTDFAVTTVKDTNGVQRATVDPTDPAMFQELLSVVATEYQSIGIGYLWGLDDALAVDDLPTLSLQLSAGLLHLVQALVDTKLSARLWVATAGCQIPPIGEGEDGIVLNGHQTQQVQPAASGLWGLGRTIALEQPQLHCTCIDLHDHDDDGRMAALRQELVVGMADAESEQQVLYQDGVRYAAEIARWEAPSVDQHEAEQNERDFVVSSAGSYLITGGLGALGLQIAQQLVEDGATYLVLTSRRGVTTEQQEAMLAQLQEAGAVVAVVQADIANFNEAQKVVERCTALAPLRGIVHAAGVLDDGMLTSQTLTRFDAVMRPKVNGAWHLHTLTQGLALDFFVNFSSASALAGAPGQSNYAAANAFLDGLAYYRQQLGLPCQSINWGPWGSDGMAAYLQERWQQQGLAMIAPQQGKQLFRYLLQEPVAQMGVLPVNVVRPVVQVPQTQQTIDWQGYKTMTPAERTVLIIEILREIVMAIGGFTAEQLDDHGSLLAMGIDSLMAVELRNYTIQLFDLSMPISLFLDGGTIASLADYIVEHLEIEALSDSMSPTATVTNNSLPPIGINGDSTDGIVTVLVAEAAQAQESYQKVEGEL